MAAASFDNPCELVRRTCREWTEKHDGSNPVSIDRKKLGPLADEILEAHRSRRQSRDGTNTNISKEAWIEWDAEGWHYAGEGFFGTEAEKRNRVVLYLLALDAINFCFWPLPEGEDDDAGGSSTQAATATIPATNPLEYEHLAMAMKSMAEADHGNNENTGYAFSPENLAATTVEEMARLFRIHTKDPDRYRLPNLPKRAALWRELGEGLLEHQRHKNSTNNSSLAGLAFLEAARGDASALVALVAETFPGFRDEVFFSGEEGEATRVVFLKRAQILVGDLDAALRLDLEGLERLTTFADYRVPQLLRHSGILVYGQRLAATVDAQQEIPRGSPEEISIRAATVVAVEDLVGVLNDRCRGTAGGDSGRECEFTDVTVDWYLWQVGERLHQEGRMKPFHRVRTHFY